MSFKLHLISTANRTIMHDPDRKFKCNHLMETHAA